MSEQPAMELRNLTKYYGKHRGAENVSFTVEPGEVFGFVGPNGAGKSTTIKLLLNMLYPTAGSGRILGLDIVRESRAIKRHTAYVPCDVRFYADMRVGELFAATRRFHGVADRGEEKRLAGDFKLETGKRFCELSTGNKKKAALVNAFLSQPRVMILDEPTNGLDPLMREVLFAELGRRAARGATVLMSSHNLAEIQEYAGRAAFIKAGRILTVQRLDKNSEPVKILTLTGGSAAPLLALGAEILSQKGEKTVLRYAKSLPPLPAAIAAAAPQDFLVRDLSLEERFHEYYADAPEGGENHDAV